MAERSCGGCTVCCFIGGVPEIDKPGHAVCPNACAEGCSIYDKPEKPQVCSDFKCAWLYGVGGEEDRPDKSGVLVSINRDGGRDLAYAIEVKPHAVYTTGAAIIAEHAKRVPLPVVIVRSTEKPPNDVGTLVTISKPVQKNSKRMMGRPVRAIAGVQTFKLISEAK